MSKLKITTIQEELHWEDSEQNLQKFRKIIENINDETDLIVLPEMFNTGFTNTVKLADKPNGKVTQWMKEMAAEKGCVITGSAIVQENGSNYNRLIWMCPDGSYETYDKRHLFRMAGEHNYFDGGKKRLVVELKGWRICPLVCYDLRFPAWSRNLNPFKNPDREPVYDLLIYIANWPEVRNSAWNILLPARAIENHCYTVGVNRIGNDGNGISYSGDTAVYDFKGEKRSHTKAHQAQVETIELSMAALKKYREKFPVFMDSDRFQIL